MLYKLHKGLTGVPPLKVTPNHFTENAQKVPTEPKLVWNLILILLSQAKLLTQFTEQNRNTMLSSCDVNKNILEKMSKQDFMGERIKCDCPQCGQCQDVVQSCLKILMR